MEKLNIIQRSGMVNVAAVILEGVLDINTVENFETVLNELFKKGKYKIVLNIEKLTYCSSAGIGILLGCIKNIRKNGGDLKISNVPPDIYKIFEMVELTQMFHIYKTEEEAIASF